MLFLPSPGSLPLTTHFHCYSISMPSNRSCTCSGENMTLWKLHETDFELGPILMTLKRTSETSNPVVVRMQKHTYICIQTTRTTSFFFFLLCLIQCADLNLHCFWYWKINVNELHSAVSLAGISYALMGDPLSLSIYGDIWKCFEIELAGT